MSYSKKNPFDNIIGMLGLDHSDMKDLVEFVNTYEDTDENKNKLINLEKKFNNSNIDIDIAIEKFNSIDLDNSNLDCLDDLKNASSNSCIGQQGRGCSGGEHKFDKVECV